MRVPHMYPHRVQEVQPLETHFSWVFLAGEFAYKLKKPMQHGRMHHASLSARRHSCYAELELNRRLAPQVYLAVVPLLAGASGELFLHGEGEPVEWLVKMRCLPGTLFLDRCIREQRLELMAVQSAGRVLADFYRACESVAMTAKGYGERLRSQMQTNQDELRSPELDMPPELVVDIARRQGLFLDKQAALVGVRAEHGKIVEGHGDLRPEHVHLEEPVCVIDCVEFDRDLRILDPLDELAFLSMECEMLDAAWVGHEIVEIYRSRSGDEIPEALLRFYCSHRAMARARMIAWHLRDPLYRGRADWRGRAIRYLLLARTYLEEL